MGQTKSKDTFSINKSCGLYESNIPVTKNDKNCLFLIDPQNDFVNGSLQVDGAKQDSIRTAAFIYHNINDIDNIIVTLDTHAKFHIAHPDFWQMKKVTLEEKTDPTTVDWSNAELKSVGSFTPISRKSIREGELFGKEEVTETLTAQVIEESIEEVDERNSGENTQERETQTKKVMKYTYVKYFVRRKEFASWALEYTKKLEKNNKQLMIWPEHCLRGTEGHNVVKVIADAILAWESVNNKPAQYVTKGNNSKSEHYSAFQAEVTVTEDKRTFFNVPLYNTLTQHARIYIAGQARSHCVKSSVEDLVNRMHQKREINTKLILLKGSMSDVASFEKVGEAFWNEMLSKKGIKELDITEITSDVAVENLSTPALFETSVETALKTTKAFVVGTCNCN